MKELPANIAGNPSINACIHRALKAIGRDEVASALLRKFRNHRLDDLGKLHAYRELLFGEWAAQWADEVQYDPCLNHLTPDWLVILRGKRLLLEVATIHTSRDVLDAIQSNDIGTVAYHPCEAESLRKCVGKVEQKLSKYEAVEGIDGILVGLFIDIDVGLTAARAIEAISSSPVWNHRALAGIAVIEETAREEITARLRRW